MNIFEKRPLCLILCIGLCGFFLFSLDKVVLRIGLLAISILLCIISLILKIKADVKILIRLCSAAILLSSLFSFLYFDLHFKAYDLYEGEVEIVGVVENVSLSSPYTTRLLVKAESINGKFTPGYSFYSYAKKTDAKGIIEGTKVSFSATLEGFSNESMSYNIAKGINAYASDVTNLNIIEYTDGGIDGNFARMREYITRYIISKSDRATGAIVSALLLGERDYLPDQLRLDFKRIGISHILALSGMHLAILSLGIEKVLLLFGINKKTRVVITAAFVFLYMALTGLSVSVVRAGLMLILSSTLYLFSHSKDSFTSLAVAVTIICILSPNAIFDVSLQLSALATFGIIALGEISGKFKKPKTCKEKIISYLSMGFLASMFAISATMAVSTVNFGGFSILAPFATIVFSLLAEAIMFLGCLLVLIGWVLPIGIALSPICYIMSNLAVFLSSIEFTYVSSNFYYVIIIILIYTVVFYLYTILKLNNPIKVLNVLVIVFCIINIIPTIATVSADGKETVAYYSDSKCDEVLIRSKNEVCLINSAQYEKNLAYTTVEFLENANVTYLDKYYLTHYSWSIDDEIKLMLSNILVEKIYLPAPRNDDENTILKILYKAVENHRTEIVLFKDYETVTIGEYNINLLYSSPYGETSMNAFVVAKGNTVYTYISSGLLESDMRDKLHACISLSDYVILGEHGKKYKEKLYFKEYYPELKGIVIQSENLFLQQENMQYYINNGCHIYARPGDFVYFINQ